MNSDEAAAQIVARPRLARIGGAAAARWLARPFGLAYRTRILLVFENSPLAWPQFFGFLRDRGQFQRRGVIFRAVHYGEVDHWVSKFPPTAIFLQSPYAESGDELVRKIAMLAAAYPSAPITYFDWGSPTDLRFSQSVAAHASRYVKKAVFREDASYLSPPEGDTNLVDYFSRTLDVPIVPRAWDLEPAILDRLVVGPAFHTGFRLVGTLAAHASPPAGERTIDLHARFATQGTPWYSAMRRHAMDAARSLDPSIRVVSDGLVGRRAFMAELARSKLCFSPFGYGELCVRDYEAVLMGAVLIKPDMSHLRTDPDIYQANETYIPVKWDLSDLNDKIGEILSNNAARERVAKKAYTILRDHLKNNEIGSLLEMLIY